MKPAPQFTVLVVEDHADSRESLKTWLEWKGWRVLTATDQASGLALAQKCPIDLLICDLTLPDGNGWELMEKLKKTKSVRALISSGHCASTDVARSKAVGYLDHLIKPYPVEELDAWLGRIQKALEKHTPASDPDAKPGHKDGKAKGR